MNRNLIWIAISTLVIGLALYFLLRPSADLNIAPDAAREIEKAKRR